MRVKPTFRLHRNIQPFFYINVETIDKSAFSKKWSTRIAVKTKKQIFIYKLRKGIPFSCATP